MLGTKFRALCLLGGHCTLHPSLLLEKKKSMYLKAVGVSGIIVVLVTGEGTTDKTPP